MGMTNEEREKHIRIANMLIGAINDLIRPILMYQIEKDVTREALENYIKMLEQQPCDDCISRAEAINVVHKYFMDYLKLNDDICLDGIRSLPSVTPQQTRWIPVSERLPEKQDCYLVTTKWKGSYSDNVYIETNMAVYRERPKEWDCKDVIAWMPLPEPYKAESEVNTNDT